MKFQAQKLYAVHCNGKLIRFAVDGTYETNDQSEIDLLSSLESVTIVDSDLSKKSSDDNTDDWKGAPDGGSDDWAQAAAEAQAKAEAEEKAKADAEAKAQKEAEKKAKAEAAEKLKALQAQYKEVIGAKAPNGMTEEEMTAAIEEASKK